MINKIKRIVAFPAQPPDWPDPDLEKSGMALALGPTERRGEEAPGEWIVIDPSLYPLEVVAYDNQGGVILRGPNRCLIYAMESDFDYEIATGLLRAEIDWEGVMAKDYLKTINKEVAS